MVLEQKQIRFEENKTDLTLEKTQLNATISDLRTSLSNPTQVSYYSEDAGQVITTSSTSARKALQKELSLTIADRDTINVKLEAVQDSILSLDTQLLDLEIGNEEQRELGPLKYLAETTGKEMGTVVNWFLLLIVFVFDPLAIAMVVAANFAFAQIKSKEEDLNIPEEGPDMREPLGEWADKEIVIEDEESPDPVTTSEDTYEGPIEDEVIVTPEQEEKIKLENDLDDEGGRLDGSDEKDIYEEKKKPPKPERPRSGGYWF